ncbi:magnesium transporter CorA family protein [Paractinoplanes durhamensis]|nr:CorA family divalent cation transporter [Actinoplanes durhamensis]
MPMRSFTEDDGPSRSRIWRHLHATGEIERGRGLLSMHRRMAAGVTWQHLDRADDSGVRTFVSTSGFADGDELLEAALIGPRRIRIVEHGNAVSFAFLTTHWIAAQDRVVTEPIVLVLADDYVLTVSADGAIDLDAVARRIQALGAGDRHRPAEVSEIRSVLLLGLIERVMAGFAECTDELVAMLNRIEETVFANAADGLTGSRAIYRYKRELMTVKRAVIPLRQPLTTILGRPPTTPRRLSGIENELAQVVERVLYCDDAINSMLHANLTQVDVAQNSDMRRIAAIGAVLAGWGILAGVYQMTEDFEELHRAHGTALFWSTIAVATAISVLLCVLFRRIRWL